LGFIIGNGLKIDLATEGMPGLIACILANHLGPKNEFLADACERVDKVLVELKKIGVKVTGLKAEGAA
jgi:hypothetical protein